MTTETINGTAAEEPVDAEVVGETPMAVTPGAELAARPHGNTELIRADTPAERVEQATAMATALDKVIKAQGMRTKVGRAKVVQENGTEKWVDKYHVNVEGWQTLATFLGLAVVPVYTRQVIDPTTGKPERVKYTVTEKAYYPKGQGGGLKHERTFEVDGYSWEARVEVYKDGALISAGEAMCARSEGPWKDRDDFALRGMAQTRAQSRAIAGTARWIVTLAGYAPTPTEEMPAEQPVEPEAQPVPAWAQPAPSLDKATKALTYFLADGPDGIVDEVLARISKDTGDAGIVPLIATRALLHLALAHRSLSTTQTAETAPDPGATAPPDGPAPGTVALPAMTGSPARDIENLRDAGCICKSPLEANSDRAEHADKACPMSGHGIGF